MTQTKEGAMLSWPDSDQPIAALDAARHFLAEEWREANPQTPDQVLSFYQGSALLADDLREWHALPERQEWTRMLVHVAQQAGARLIVDIGCGAGHDLRALREALPDAALCGVEPNDALRVEVLSYAVCLPSVEEAPLADANLLVCIDVLEHVPDPETFLAGIAQRAQVGCLLFETTATHDCGTPLHLPANRGWHPGHVLEQYGWQVVDQADRVRVWRRDAETGQQRASLLLCAYRSVSVQTLSCLLSLVGNPGPNRWRVRVKPGDALISRSRSIIVTAWLRETADDVLLMVDDDVAFQLGDADRLVELCRNGYDIVCGAYPTHDGAHLACRCLPGTGGITFGPGQMPVEIQYAATGCVAISRRVLETLVGTVPLCHATEPWSFYPLFEAQVTPNEDAGGYEWLSEDFAFSALARHAGFRVWLDPQTILAHHGAAAVSVRNMGALHAALGNV